MVCSNNFLLQLLCTHYPCFLFEYFGQGHASRVLWYSELAILILAQLQGKVVPPPDGLAWRYLGQCWLDELAILCGDGNFQEVEPRRIVRATLYVLDLYSGAKRR